MSEITNTQRAFWMVLITSLAAPLAAALIEVALTLASPLFGFEFPASGQDQIGDIALKAFSWSAMPAAIGAIGLVPYVLQSGTYSWLHAAVAGVLAFGAGAIIAPIGAGPAMPLLAFLSGLIAVAVRAALIEGRILKP